YESQRHRYQQPSDGDRSGKGALRLCDLQSHGGRRLCKSGLRQGICPGTEAGEKTGSLSLCHRQKLRRKGSRIFPSKYPGYVGEALLALDWEGNAVEKGVGYALEFLETVFGETGVRPLIYMNSHTAKSYDWKPVTEKNYGLWLAQ